MLLLPIVVRLLCGEKQLTNTTISTASGAVRICAAAENAAAAAGG